MSLQGSEVPIAVAEDTDSIWKSRRADRLSVLPKLMRASVLSRTCFASSQIVLKPAGFDSGGDQGDRSNAEAGFVGGFAHERTDHIAIGWVEPGGAGRPRTCEGIVLEGVVAIA